MKGSAPKSPLTGSHAERAKKCHPNWCSVSRDRTTRMMRIKATIAKMEDAQKSIRPAKLRSAMLPLGRELRKARIAEGGAGVASGGRDGSVAAGTVFRGGIADLDLISVVILEIKDTSALVEMQLAELFVS